MTDRESTHLMVKMDFTSNTYNGFPFYLCADSNPEVRNHSSVVTADISRATVLTALPAQRSHSPLNSEILCSLPITNPLLLDRNSSIRLQDVIGTGAQSYFLFAQGTQIECQPSVVQNHHPLCTHRGTDLINVSVTANIWSNELS